MEPGRAGALLALACAFAISAAVAAGAAPSPPAVPRADRVTTHYGIYYIEPPAREPRKALVEAVTALQPERVVVDSMDGEPPPRFVFVADVADPANELPAPDAESLGYFGEGLSTQQVRGLQDPAHALALAFGHPGPGADAELAKVSAVLLRVSERTGGVIWDADARKMLTPAAWRAARIESDATPSAYRHIAIHTYRSGDASRSVTVGMSKFGLPDLVVERHLPTHHAPVGTLINAVAQWLVEGNDSRPNREFELEIAALRDAESRAMLQDDVFSNATLKARLGWRAAQREAGDNENTLIALSFHRYDGENQFARQSAAVSETFGWSDAIKNISHDAELEAASEQARKRLPGLRRAFRRGLEPGEFVQVKAPFEIPGGGREWMWVEVLRWNGDEIEGALSNEPFNIPTMKSGQIVKVRQQDVFDYLHVKPDGTVDGNATSAIIERMQAPTESAGGE